MKSILELTAGETGVVQQILGTGAVRQRMLDMGILPKERVRLERIAPSGDPVWIELDGTHLALRRREAASVLLATDG